MPALKAVLKAFDQHQVDGRYCLGDIVGYFHQSLEVLDEMIKSGIPTIMGNHEAYLIGKLSVSAEKYQFINLEYVKKKISPSQRAWLEKLPLSFEAKIDHKSVAGFHGSPWSYLEEYIYPDYRDFERFQTLPWDYILLGHTHLRMIKKIGNTTVINPGSCGQPRQGDYKANAAVLDTHSGDVQFLDLDYDVQNFILSAQQAGVNPEVIHRLKVGK